MNIDSISKDFLKKKEELEKKLHEDLISSKINEKDEKIKMYKDELTTLRKNYYENGKIIIKKETEEEIKRIKNSKNKKKEKKLYEKEVQATVIELKKREKELLKENKKNDKKIKKENINYKILLQKEIKGRKLKIMLGIIKNRIIRFDKKNFEPTRNKIKKTQTKIRDKLEPIKEKIIEYIQLLK